MAENLFLLGKDNSLKVMEQTGFISEDVFQEILARFPALLTDSNFGEAAPRRWMLVRREAGIADREGGAERWSVDHIFLDQDGVPTLVEVKRATDTRARREVVAQMLDYAANSVRWLSLELLSQWYTDSCAEHGTGTVDGLATLLQTEAPDVDSYWRGVEANLRSGRIRMVFVADQISPELQSIVEFLNEQMSPASIAAVELRPYSNGGERILVPRLIGATARAIEKKNIPRALQAQSVEEWFKSTLKDGAETKERVSEFSHLLAGFGCKEAVAGKSLAFDFVSGDLSLRPCYVRETGKAVLSAFMLSKSAAYGTEEARRDLLNGLEAAGFKLSTKSSNGEPTFDLPALGDSVRWTSLKVFFSALFKGLGQT
jgi:hypothetical protein